MDGFDIHPLAVLFMGCVTLNTVDLQINRHAISSPIIGLNA
jgi:hypothetical protein